MGNPGETKVKKQVESFERNVVFRTARGYFLFMALCAVLVFGGGVAAGAMSFVKVSIPEPPPLEMPEALPPPEPLSYASVKAWMAEQEKIAQESRTRRAASVPLYEDEGSDGYDAEEDEFDQLVERLQALFPEPEYTWDDTYVETCSVPSSYGCLRRSRSLEREGVYRVVRAALADQSRTEAITTLRTLVTVLAEAPVADRARLVLPTREAYVDTRRDYRIRLMEQEAEMGRLEREFEEMVAMYEAKLAEQEEAKATQRSMGLYAIFGGLILLVLVSVFLVHFAIERHLRLLQTLVQRVGPTDGMS